MDSGADRGVYLRVLREALRRQGLSERDIWDVAAVTAFFNMTNRLAAATDMRPNEAYHGQFRTPAE